MPARRPTLADFEEPIDADYVAGQDEAKERVERFLEDKIVNNPEVEGDVHLELSQLGTGSTMVLKTWLFSQGDDSATVAEAVVDAAIEDGGAAANGKTKYQVTLRGRTGRCAFALEYQPRSDDDVDEVPNAKGLVAQSMKHTQQAWGMVQKVIGQTLQAAEAQRKSDQEEIKALRGGQIETIQTLASLYDARHARDVETRKIEKSEGRKDEVAGFLMQGIPALVNKFVGGGKPGSVLPEASTPLEQMLHGFLSTFTPEQLQTMVQTGNMSLNQQQMFGMLEIFKTVKDRHDAQEAARNRGAQAQNGASGPAAPGPSPTDSPPAPPYT